jgi:hypothetical protein
VPDTDFEPGLAEALHQARTLHGNGYEPIQPECPLCIVLRYAKPGVREALEAAAAGTMSVRALHRALRASDVRLDRASVQKHRNEGHTP